ncbi:MAG: TIGR04076 family protein [Methanomicrobiales archaeon]|jgi:uncharacterized repeat protein (TIGR04076 family)|nr:TIGR04076 family protein [Methanomicrobiales archaeon]
MKMCKIEVLKTTFDAELSKEYGCDGLGPCPIHTVGDVFYGHFAKPEGLCDDAWKAMHHYVFAIAHECDSFFDGDWIKTPGVAICSCCDGLRPVIFKISRTEEAVKKE